MAQDLAGLNSLRQALTPYDDVKFELNLNRHPKAHKNKSLVYAENMKLSNDGAVLENEESIKINNYINDVLTDYYNEFKIIYIIPCNTELVLFVKGSENNNFQIWRYREKTSNYTENISIFYNKEIPYNGGSFSGTFTYTSNDSLIIAFCEYPENNNQDFMSPMMTINLGTFTKGYTNKSNTNHLKCRWESTINEFNDRDLETYKLPICPEVSLPQITNVSNIKGNSYIGTYYVYIRYKINKYDYTQWFNIGYPIINEFKQDTTLHEKVTTNAKNEPDGETLINDVDLKGAYATNRICKLTTYINQNVDLINNCLNIKIQHKDILYNYCQIGFICISKTYTKYFVTNDIKLNEDIIVSTNIDNIKEEIFNTNIYENYFNVKNIINKDNKLYISNYKTTNNNKNLNVDDIKLTLETFEIITEYEEDETSKDIVINDINFKEEDILKTYESSINVYDYDNNEYKAETEHVKLISLPYYFKFNNIEIKSKYAKYKNNSGETAKFKVEDIFIGVIERNIHSMFNGGNPGYKTTLIKVLDEVIIENESYYKNKIAYNFKYNVDVGGSTMSFIHEPLNIYFLNDDGDIIDTIDLNSIRSKLIITKDINPEDYSKDKIYYRNTLDNKINNNVLTGLCKGEIYDFYIHFIDIYGNITNGYKLKNKSNQILIGEYLSEPKNFRKAAFFIDKKYNNIVAFNANENCVIKTENGDDINITGYWGQFLNEADELDIYKNIKVDGKIVDVVLGTYGNVENAINRYKEEFEPLLHLPDSIRYSLKWGDILDYIPNELIRFIDYKNSQNDLFFKTPKLICEKGDIQLGLKVEINDITKYGDYVGYFISHKKLEKTYVLQGFGTKNQINNIILNDKFKSGNIVKVYDIKNNVDWNVYLKDKCSIQEDVIHKNGFETYINLLNKLAYANNGQLDRIDRQTTLYLSESIKEFNGYPEDNNNVIRGTDGVKYLEILNINNNKYVNSDNKLYRLGNIEKNTCIINKGLNGKYDKHLAIKYGNEEEGVNNLLSDTGLGTYGDVYLYEIFGFFDYDNLGLYLSQSAKFHDIYNKKITNVGNKEYYDKIGTDIFYEVITTLNLFNYKISNIYDTWINFYNVFDKDDGYLKEFNRTIYRSAVISDESRTNNWRWFENDAYKNIEENKGNITNLLAIGNYLYVHTEHSLYAFSEDNTLSMNNQNLQVATPDIFETEYKEVFISSLGYGGLQDKDAWVSGQFGYIWFNNDTKQILKVYGNSMDIISNDIKEWLENCNILNVRFANDIKNNRILMNIKIQMLYYNQNVEKDIILSYNILSKTFISLHDYSFNNTYNTKNNLYFLDNNINITKFIEDNYGKNIDKEKQYKVYFIINKYYNTVKYLENIVYKLRKRNIKSDINMLQYVDINDFINFPVEQRLLSYSGKNIRVFNDLVDTDWLDCNTDNDGKLPNNEIKDFNKPYWNLGNWNFNYLRDINNHNANPEARLFGNYFVISFDFGNVDTLIEFENLDVQLTKDKEL